MTWSRFAPILALGLAACAPEPKPGPELVMLTPPGECLSTDPAWIALPERDVTRDEGARNLKRNRMQYQDLTARRRVCRAALLAQSTGVAP